MGCVINESYFVEQTLNQQQRCSNKMHCFKSDTDQSVIHTYSFLQFCLVMLVVQKLPHFYDFQEVMISTKNGNDRSREETRRRGVREEEERSIKWRRHDRRGAGHGLYLHSSVLRENSGDGLWRMWCWIYTQQLPCPDGALHPAVWKVIMSKTGTLAGHCVLFGISLWKMCV